MDNLLSLIEHLAWLRIVAYGVIASIFLHRATSNLRYRGMNYALCASFSLGVILGAATVLAPTWLVWLRALQTPIVIAAAYYGARYWVKEGNYVVKRETGLVFLNNQPCEKEDSSTKLSNNVNKWEILTR